MKYMLIHCIDESAEGAPGGDEGRPKIEDWIAEMEGRGVLLHGDRPVIMLPAARHGMAGPVVASGLRPGDHLVLTAEPSGGASRPTTPMMLDVVL